MMGGGSGHFKDWVRRPEGTARRQPVMCSQGCGRPNHGSAACNPIAPILVFDEGELIGCESCKVYKAAIRDAILRLVAGEDPEIVASVLIDVLNP